MKEMTKEKMDELYKRAKRDAREQLEAQTEKMHNENLYRSAKEYAERYLPPGKPTTHIGVVAESLEEKPTLKLWRVISHGMTELNIRPYRASTIILAVDKNTAIEKAIDDLLADGIKSIDRTEVEELEGPFTNGSIIERREF